MEKSGPFARLMIAQDVGSAIKGPERGDLYFGTGEEAGKLAGITRHKGALRRALCRTPWPRAPMPARRSREAFQAALA